MKVLLIGITVLLASVNAKLAEKPVRLADCPLEDDPQNPTHLSYPSDCGKFYKCLGDWGYPMQCPAGLHWNDVAKLCDWPDQANCKTSNKPILIAEETEKPIKHKDCRYNDFPGKTKHLPYPNNCTKFYKCSYGYAFPMNCPSGEHFGVYIDRCDWPWIAKCDSNATPPPPPTDTTTEPTTSQSTESTNPQTTESTPPQTTESTVPPITTPEPLPPGINCSNVLHGTLYPHPDSCKKFIQCDYGVGAVKYCPSNLHFNPKLLVCDWPEAAGCLVDEDPMHPTHLSYPGNCAKFFKCFRGDAYPMDCPSGLHWSIKLDRCDYPEIAKCDKQHYGKTTLKSNTVIPPDFDEDKAFRYEPCPLFKNPELEKTYQIYFPFPKKCNKYLKCSYGFAVPTYCPQGLHWSTKYSRCDWPRNARCV